jgi:hypothetical protein
MLARSLACAVLAVSVAVPLIAMSSPGAGPAITEVSPAFTPVTSKVFSGPKANKGNVTLDMKDGAYMLTLSDDFVTPDTPAPHWRLVDSSGNMYLLQRLKTKDRDAKGNRSITVPDYIHDIAKVQIYCAWAEVVLGETTFNGVQELSKDSSHAAFSGPHVSTKFAGPKANTGTVTHAIKDGKSVLTLSDDFVTPDTPAPHWRLVDSDGRTYLLQSLKTKGDGSNGNRSIVVPAYIPDVAKVQVYCAWAEVVLGEASFAHPVH